MNSMLPPDASTFGVRIDSLFNLILVITSIVFVLVQVTLIVFAFRYRRRDGRKADYVHGSRNLEIVWTSATTLIVLVIALLSRGLWLDLKDPARFPAPSLEVLVTASQFEWNVTYPGADGQLGTGDDFVRRNQLHVPVGVPIRVNLAAVDVIHSFFIPDMRVKQDAVPGMHIPTWFQATETGTFGIGCAELCGLGHYRMRGTLTVHSADDFAQWQLAQLDGADDPETPAVIAPVAAAQTHAHH